MVSEARVKLIYKFSNCLRLEGVYVWHLDHFVKRLVESVVQTTKKNVVVVSEARVELLYKRSLCLRFR